MSHGSNGTATAVEPEPKPDTISRLLDELDGIEGQLAIQRNLTGGLEARAREIRGALVRTMQARPGQVIAHDSECYLVDRGVALRRPLAWSHQVPVVPEADDVRPDTIDGHPVFDQLTTNPLADPVATLTAMADAFDAQERVHGGL